jgi:hypothetical protein
MPREFNAVDRATFEGEIDGAGMPVVLRGLVAEWPVCSASAKGMVSLAGYLKALDHGAAVNTFVGPSTIAGRYFYDDAMRGFNFDRHTIPFVQVIDKLLEIAETPNALSIYSGSIGADGLLPRFAAENAMPLLPNEVEPRLWLGNRSRIAAHYDMSHNLACAVSGKRQFTLFPPDQIGNLYVGPLDFNMAGQPASLVDFAAPDFDRFPKFRDALSAAIIIDLEPGDALYLPALWWHHVEAAGPFNLLVNYWWPGAGDGPGLESLVLALLALRDRDPAEKAAWRDLFDHYVFGDAPEDAAKHIPPHAQGVLGPQSGERARRILQFLQARLGGATN